MMLSVIIPVYNEVKTILEVVERVQATPDEKEILIIDDGSTDGTREKLKEISASNIRVILHEKNQGKGAAIQTGWKHASGDVLLIQDADTEYDPSDYPQLLEPIRSGK